MLDLAVNTRYIPAVTSETLGVVTITPTNVTNSGTYSISVTQLNPNATGVEPSVIQRVISVNTPAVGAITATTVSDQFKNEYFSLTNPFHVTTNALLAGTVVLTAEAGYPILFASFYNSGLGAAADVVNSTPGIQTTGLPADMVELGVDSALITGSDYDLYVLQNSEFIGDNNAQRVNSPEHIYIWVNNEDDDSGAFKTALNAILNANDGGAVQTEWFDTGSIT
jgi:hypothetical protein